MSTHGDYDEDGFLLGRRLLPADVLTRLAGIGERVHARWLGEQGSEGRRHALVNSHGLTATRFFPTSVGDERRAFFDALADPVLHDLVATRFGDDLYFHGTQMFFHPLGPRRPYWHRDVQYMGIGEERQRALLPELCQLHVRIPLRAERRFLLVPGSHLRWDGERERDVRLERAGHQSWEELPSARGFDLEPGDVLLFSAHMLHRGTYDENADRLSLDLMVAKPHPGVPLRQDADQLPTDAELRGIRRPQWYRRARELLARSRRAGGS